MLLPALSRGVLDSAGNKEMPQRLPAARLSSKRKAEISSVAPVRKPVQTTEVSINSNPGCAIFGDDLRLFIFKRV